MQGTGSTPVPAGSADGELDDGSRWPTSRSRPQACPSSPPAADGLWPDAPGRRRPEAARIIGGGTASRRIRWVWRLVLREGWCCCLGSGPASLLRWVDARSAGGWACATSTATSSASASATISPLERADEVLGPQLPVAVLPARHERARPPDQGCSWAMPGPRDGSVLPAGTPRQSLTPTASTHRVRRSATGTPVRVAPPGRSCSNASTAWTVRSVACVRFAASSPPCSPISTPVLHTTGHLVVRDRVRQEGR